VRANNKKKPPLGATPYKGPFDVVKRTVKSEGVRRGLFKGMGATMLREMVGNAFWFGVYESSLLEFGRRLGQDRENVPLKFKALGGALAGMAYWAAPYPFDTLKSIQQTNTRFSGWSMRKVFTTVYAEAGLRGLYQGLPVTLMRAAPAHALVFVTFESVNARLLLS